MKQKRIVGFAFVVTGVLFGYSSTSLETGAVDKLFNEAVVSSGSNYVKCERELPAADGSVRVTLQANLHNGKKGRADEYKRTWEYLEWLVKRSPVTEGGSASNASNPLVIEAELDAVTSSSNAPSGWQPTAVWR